MADSANFLARLMADQGIDPLMQHLEILGAPQMSEQGAGLQVRLKDFHMNGGGSAHGGLIMTLMDVVMACSTFVSGRDQHCVTVEMKSNFMRPGGQAGDVLNAQGFLRSSSRSLAFCDAEVRNEAGELLATASGTFKYIKRPVSVL
ncbi:PaaI family thioesterase [Pseudomonas fluorescens]|nr:PaaI family thioesterase [Pseudomonas fluorescens]